MALEHDGAHSPNRDENKARVPFQRCRLDEVYEPSLWWTEEALDDKDGEVLIRHRSG